MRSWRALTRRIPRSLPRDKADEGPLLDRQFLDQIEQLRLTDLGSVLAGLMGEHQGHSKTQAIEFADYRGYTPGDDFRQIDWNAYARLDELFVKASMTEENISLSLLLDCSRSMDWGQPNKLRYAKRLAAALGAIALLHYDTVRIYALGDGRAEPGTPLRGHEALPLLLRELESLPIAATTDLLHGIEDFRSMSEQTGAVVLLSDLLVTREQQTALRYLRADRARAAVLHLIDPREAEPTLGGLIELRDRETGQIAELTITSAVRQRYQERFEAWVHALEAQCTADGIRYVRVSTAVPPADLLVDVLRRHDLVQA